MVQTTNLKAFAVDIDGVLVKDTFSPVMKKLIESFGGYYSSEVENNIFSRPQKEAAKYCIDYLELDYSTEEIIELYFKKRDKFLKENPYMDGFVDGIDVFLELLSSYNLRIICYGGLNIDYFKFKLGDYSRYFEEYICTNEIRPGIYEIIKNYFNYNFNEVLFFDDVCSVAIEAKELGVPFIGVIYPDTIGFQSDEMVRNKIKYKVNSVKDIDYKLIEKAST